MNEKQKVGDQNTPVKSESPGFLLWAFLAFMAFALLAGVVGAIRVAIEEGPSAALKIPFVQIAILVAIVIAYIYITKSLFEKGHKNGFLAMAIVGGIIAVPALLSVAPSCNRPGPIEYDHR